MKRSGQSSSSDASAPLESKKRKIAYSTYQKWKTELDRDCQTITWLDCDTEVSGEKKIVTRLRCAVCSKFKASIATRKILVRSGFGVPSQFAPVTFEIMPRLTSIPMQ